MVSSRRKGEIRWGLGLVAFILTLISLWIFADFQGSAIGNAAGWGLLIGILAAVLFFYLLLPSRQPERLPPGNSRRRRR